MYHAELHHTVTDPSLAIDPIRVGPVPSGLGTPGIYVTVANDGLPLARIDAWPLVAGAFTEVIAWKNFVVLGWNSLVHLVDPITRKAISIECSGYFGHLYPLEDRLLVADDYRLVCISDCGERLWESENLAIDGVLVDEVRNGEIIGQGECDPPGGWKPFRLSLATGREIH